MRGKISLLLAAMLIASTLMVNMGTVFAITPTISIDPTPAHTNPGQVLSVDIMVADVVNLASWEVSLTWDLSLTEFPPVVTEGPFLKTGGGITGFQYIPDLALKKIAFGAFRFGGSVSGSGVLATVDFTVVNSGASVLDLFETKLADPGQNYMAHDTIDGSFDTTYPFVDFTMSPTNPDIGEVVTFDGSLSYDPDGGSIVSYSWDFGDGNTDTGMVVTHSYTAYRYEPYEVTLTCTDDEAETWYKTKDMWIWRDITVGPIWYDPSWWLDLSMFENALGANPMIHVAVANLGSLSETFDVNMWAVHDETGYEPVIVPMWGNPVSLAPGTGAGFATLAFWMATPDDLTGYYTIHAEAVVGDSDTSNNHASLRIRLGEGKLIMARAETRTFSISKRGSELTLYGKVKNSEKWDSAPMGLYCWVRFEVVTPESEVLILDTNSELLYNDEDSSQLMTSLMVEPGIYSFTAYGIFSIMDYYSTIFYETDLDWLPLSGTSTKIKTFTVNVVP